jgi:guanylate kinase
VTDQGGNIPARGRLFVISGPSGAGKSTIINAILKKKPALAYSISYTTRVPRGREKDGVEYFFVSESVFKKMIDAGAFVEWACVHDRFYGTSAMFIEKTITSGKDVVLDIDVEGAKKIFAKYPDAVSIFIAPPDLETLKERLVKRGTDGPAVIERRLENAKREMAQSHRYAHVLVNRDLQETISGLERIVGDAR